MGEVRPQERILKTHWCAHEFVIPVSNCVTKYNKCIVIDFTLNGSALSHCYTDKLNLISGSAKQGSLTYCTHGHWIKPLFGCDNQTLISVSQEDINVNNYWHVVTCGVCHGHENDMSLYRQYILYAYTYKCKMLYYTCSFVNTHVYYSRTYCTNIYGKVPHIEIIDIN